MIHIFFGYFYKFFKKLWIMDSHHISLTIMKLKRIVIYISGTYYLIYFSIKNFKKKEQNLFTRIDSVKFHKCRIGRIISIYIYYYIWTICIICKFYICICKISKITIDTNIFWLCKGTKGIITTMITICF